MQSVKDEIWYIKHPLRCRIEADPKSCLPFFIFADDAPATGSKSIRAAFMSSPFCFLQSLCGKLVLGILNEHASA